MEQQSAFNSLNMTYSAQPHHGSAKDTTFTNFTVRTLTITTFLCPSDANVPTGVPPSGQYPPGATPLQIGYTSYPNNIGTTYNNNGGRLDGPAFIMGPTTTGYGE